MLLNMKCCVTSLLLKLGKWVTVPKKEKKGKTTGDEHDTTGIKDGNPDSASLFISMPIKLTLNNF